MRLEHLQEASYHRPNYVKWIYDTFNKILHDDSYTFVDDFIVLPLDQREEVERQLTAEFGQSQQRPKPWRSEKRYRPWWKTTINDRTIYIDTDVTPEGTELELGLEVEVEDE